MTIATEITALNNNLAAAKTAVTNKGGTVGDTGLAGLATEIASIPAGGASWGSVTYLDSGVSKTVTVNTMAEMYSLAGSANSWTATIGGETITNTTITSVTVGKDFSLFPTNFCTNCTNLTSMTFENGNPVKTLPNYFCKNTGITSLTLPSGIEKIGDYFMNNCNGITSLTFPSSLTTIGRDCFSNCTTIVTISGLDNVTTIGNNFCANTPLDCDISLPALENTASNTGEQFLQNCTSFNHTITINPNYTGTMNGFLKGCTSYNKPLTIPSGVKYVSNLLQNCTSFNQPLTLPTSTTTVVGMLSGCTSLNSDITVNAANQSLTLYGNTNIMQNCDSMTATVYFNCSVTMGSGTDTTSFSTTSTSSPCYATGIKISGTYAASWRSVLADRSSSPYRKLIVV